MDGAEIDFSDLLVEDQNNGAMSYLDCGSVCLCLSDVLTRSIDLCVIHKQISTVVGTDIRWQLIENAHVEPSSPQERLCLARVASADPFGDHTDPVELK